MTGLENQRRENGRNLQRILRQQRKRSLTQAHIHKSMDKLKNDDFTFTFSEAIVTLPARHGIVEESEQTDSEEKILRQVEAASIWEEVEHHKWGDKEEEEQQKREEEKESIWN